MTIICLSNYFFASACKAMWIQDIADDKVITKHTINEFLVDWKMVSLFERSVSYKHFVEQDSTRSAIQRLLYSSGYIIRKNTVAVKFYYFSRLFLAFQFALDWWLMPFQLLNKTNASVRLNSAIIPIHRVFFLAVSVTLNKVIRFEEIIFWMLC